MDNLKTVFLIKSIRSAYLQFACASQGMTMLARRIMWFCNSNYNELGKAVTLIHLLHSWI